MRCAGAVPAGALATRERMWLAGQRPVPPLEDGRDLWADDGLVFAYTRAGDVRCVMTKDEYDGRRAAMVAEAVRLSGERAAKIHNKREERK